MSDQEKNIKDEELDKVSGGGVSEPIIVERNPITGPHVPPGHERPPTNPLPHADPLK